jgi:ABC-type branched-subunit amino acid transport system ATPase component
MSSLAAEGIAVRYGGLLAVKDLTFEVLPGRITGLIGPNGAGKTSALNVCSGLIQPQHGRISFGGRSLGRMGLPSRARLGIGRSFQQIELFESLTVRDNLALGCEGALAGAGLISQLVVTSSQRRYIDDRVSDSAQRVGLSAMLDVQVGGLSTGQRRLVEFGRCLAGSYQTLLLDEPSSGLDHVETAEFGRILSEFVRDRGVGVLLVEHDMSLVMGVCDTIYVMEFGAILFKGTPEEVRSNELVRAAYLGEPKAPADAGQVDGPRRDYGRCHAPRRCRGRLWTHSGASRCESRSPARKGGGTARGERGREDDPASRGIWPD